MGWIKLIELPGKKIDSQEYDFNYWKISEGFVWHQGKKFKKADPETFEVRKDYSQVFIARDKNSVYHAWSTMKSIDRDTFEEVGNGYWKDTNLAYCEHETSIKALKGKDVKNFKFIGGPYARDSVFAYYGGRVMKSCEAPMSLKLMDENNIWIVGDGHKVFYDGAEIKGADYSSWLLVEGGFSKDCKSVFFGNKKLPRVDLESWKLLDANYSCDAKSVYNMCFKLKGANPNHWQMLEHEYSKDLERVYYGSNIVEQADAVTFKVIDVGKAVDKSNEFLGSELVVR